MNREECRELVCAAWREHEETQRKLYAKYQSAIAPIRAKYMADKAKARAEYEVKKMEIMENQN